MPQSSEPTNLLFICSDQHSRHILGAYGTPVVRTPHLDAIEEAGGEAALIAAGPKISYTPPPDA